MVISYSMKKHQRYVLCYKMRNNYNEKVVEPIMKSRNMELVNDIVKLPSKSANTWTQDHPRCVFYYTHFKAISYNMKKHQRYIFCYKMRNIYDGKLV